MKIAINPTYRNTIRRFGRLFLINIGLFSPHNVVIDTRVEFDVEMLWRFGSAWFIVVGQSWNTFVRLLLVSV